MKKLVALIFLLLPFIAFAQPPPYYVDWNGMRNFAKTNAFGTNNTVAGLGIGIPTNSPNIFWTNNVYKSFWATNGNFTIGQVGLASSNFFVSSIIISNAGNATITATLPYPCYSLSAGTTVSAAVVGASNAIDLSFYYNGSGITYVGDRGANSPQLASIAAAVGASNGVVIANNGAVYVTTNVTVWNMTVQNQMLANYFATLNGSSVGMAFSANDTLGTIGGGWYNRTGTNGWLIASPGANVVDLVLGNFSGGWSNDRFEARGSPSQTNALNVSGERQTSINGVMIESAGTNNVSVFPPLYAKQTIISNLWSTGDWITNGRTIWGDTTNYGVNGNTNYNYVCLIGAGGFIYFTSNNGLGTNLWLHR